MPCFKQREHEAGWFHKMKIKLRKILISKNNSDKVPYIKSERKLNNSIFFRPLVSRMKAFYFQLEYEISCHCMEWVFSQCVSSVPTQLPEVFWQLLNSDGSNHYKNQLCVG